MGRKARRRTIKIACQGSRMEQLSRVEIIQGDLKDLSDANFAKLRRRIEIKGFDAPLFVWRNKILDGTQRKRVLDAMVADGWRLTKGEVPVCDIEAASLEEAKDRLLGYVSQYGDITEQGLSAFLDGVEALDVETINLPGLSGPTDEEMREAGDGLSFSGIELKPYKRTHILLSFPPDLFGRISEHIEPILLIDGVEYEQASN